MASSSSSSGRVDAGERISEDRYGSQPYDVFLSHRGPDTKNGFVGFLYKDLKLAGLEPFFDVKGGAEMGVDSWASIERAIKKAPIALVIFSRNFASSMWCLKELHLILTTNVRVLPIFFEVKPSDLRYIEIEKLKAGFKKPPEDEVLQSWINDLRTASKIAGCEIEKNSMQADKVTDIVRTVRKWLDDLHPQILSSDLDKVGVKENAEEIIKTLDERRNVVMLGLWGMGGIGKTTLARELFHRLKGRYASSCLVNDVTARVIMLNGVEAVQKRILEGLCNGIGTDIDDKTHLRGLLEQRLRSKNPFLLFLDDVSNEKDMMNYIITPAMLTGGSMCIVTTRDYGVLREYESRLPERLYAHAMVTLSHEDSVRVLLSYAFGDRKVDTKIKAFAKGVSMACGGVPLVLKVIGSVLREKDVDAWKEMKESLEEESVNMMDYGAIYNPLRISYDRLSNIQKEMFLDVACGLIGRSVNFSRRVWRSLKWSPGINIDVLKGCALISENEKGLFFMHDVLRDMGRSIEMKENGGRRTRLWMPESFEMWKAKALSEHLQCLVIDFPLTSSTPTLDVSHMKQLRILSSSRCTLIEVPANLLWLNSSSLPCLPRIPQNSKLVVLYFRYLVRCRWWCKLGHMPGCTALGLGGLTALECLYLLRCQMRKLPNLQQLTKLEELHISSETFVAVPGLGHLLAVEKFNVDSDVALPGFRNMLPNLTELSTCETELKTLANVCARELQNLTVYGWTGRGPAAEISWPNLKSLTIGSSKAKKLDGLLEMKNLENITLMYSSFQDVSCLNGLTALRSISISLCMKLTQLPDLLELTRLETLDVYRSYNVREWSLLSRTVSPSDAILPSLRTLRLAWVNIEDLKEKVDRMFPKFKLEFKSNGEDRFAGERVWKRRGW